MGVLIKCQLIFRRQVSQMCIRRMSSSSVSGTRTVHKAADADSKRKIAEELETQ